MKLILKNLKQVQYNIEIPSEKNTVKELKEEIEKVHGFDANVIKLLHNGKILENDKTLEDYQLKDEHVIIMMNSKPKVQVNPQPTEQPKPESSKTEESQKKEEPPKKEEEKPKTDNSDKIQSLVDMGYKREDAEKALNISNGNLDLAIEFLTVGIPSTPIIPNQQSIPSQPIIPPGNVGGNLPGELKRYASLLKVVCNKEPEKILDILDTLKQKNPALINILSQHEEQFKNLLVSPVTQQDIDTYKLIENEMGGLGQRTVRINLTAEEREAINRLKALGDFSESDVIQAYIACDKNEELAANYLFEQKWNDDEEMNNNNNQGQ